MQLDWFVLFFFFQTKPLQFFLKNNLRDFINEINFYYNNYTNISKLQQVHKYIQVTRVQTYLGITLLSLPLDIKNVKKWICLI